MPHLNRLLLGSDAANQRKHGAQGSVLVQTVGLSAKFDLPVRLSSKNVVTGHVW